MNSNNNSSNTLSFYEVKKIAKLSSNPSLTVIVPTHRTMADRDKDPIAVKDALEKAADLLISKFGKDKVFDFINHIDDLARKIDYSQTLDSLVFFISKNFARVYNLPFKLEKKIVVDDHFYTESLTKAFSQSPNYWVLAISHKPTRLFSCTKDTIKEETETASKEQKETGFPFQWHYDMAKDSTLFAVGKGDKDAKYLSDLDKEFMRNIDKRLNNYLADNSWPLVLLGTVNNIAKFEAVSGHNSRVVGSKHGDYSTAQDNTVIHDAWPVMQKYLEDEKKAIFELIDQATSAKKLATGIEDVWSSAKSGQVRVLVLEENIKEENIKINPEISKKINSKNNFDIINNLIDLVYAKDGKVVFVPNNSLANFGQICAILRYS